MPISACGQIKLTASMNSFYLQWDSSMPIRQNVRIHFDFDMDQAVQGQKLGAFHRPKTGDPSRLVLRLLLRDHRFGSPRQASAPPGQWAHEK